MKRIYWYIFSALVLAFIFLAFYFFSSGLSSRDVSWNNQENSSDGLSDISNFFSNLFDPGEINVLVFGRPGVGFNGGNLADAIILVHFNPDQNKIFLISIPRDLWVSDELEQFKINEVLHKNKIGPVLNEVENMTGIKPDGYAIVDLNIVKEAIDYLGGADIVLTEPAVDWVSGFTLSPGPHHLSGEDAVWIIRNRFNAEGDFFREKNQQQIIADLFSKFKNLSREEKISFLKKFIFDSGVLSSAQIDLSKITPLVFDSKISDVSIENIVLDFSTKLLETKNIPFETSATTTYVSALIPKAGFGNYSDIKKYIEEKIK